MDERSAALVRFNPYHAKAGSATGGQFSSSSGGSGKAPAKAPAKPPAGHAAPPPGGSHDAAKTPKQRLLAEAHADRERARELEKELRGLEHQEHAAAAAAKHHAAQAAAAKKAGKPVHHHHHHTLHKHHHKHHATLKQRISHLKEEIHGLREKADELEHQAHVSRSGDSGIPGHLPHQLASWWEHGGGAAKIRWGEGGDFMRCVRLAVEEAHMTPERAKGFCAERHHAALGIWPATHAAMEKRVGRSAVTAEPEYDSDGLDGSWDGDHSDLPDLSGLQVSHFETADGEAGAGGESVARAMPKLGTGTRFAKLKGSLAAKGAHDPGALAAYIGRKRYGKAKFAKLASAARKGGGVSRGSLVRYCQVEDMHILRTGEGDGTGRVVEGFAAVFGQRVVIRDGQGHYEEEIDRGAFDQWLARTERRPGGLAGSVRVLYNHGKTMEGIPAPEFQRPLAKVLEMRPDARGLLTRTEYKKSPLAEEILDDIREGRLTAQSFEGPDYLSDPPLRGPGDKYRARNGVLARVRRMALGVTNFGPALYAAYSGAEFLGVRMQLPGSDEPDYTADEEYVPDTEGDGTGGIPEEMHPSRLNAHRLWRIRNEEACREAGIVLPGRD
jgi:HK97 family phage prohead protease